MGLEDFFNKMNDDYFGEPVQKKPEEYDPIADLLSKSEEEPELEETESEPEPEPKSPFTAEFWEAINNVGFIIYKSYKGFHVQKIATPMDQGTMNEEILGSMQECVDRIQFYNESKTNKYDVTICYNVGLGLDYFQKTVEAQNQNDAKSVVLDELKKSIPYKLDMKTVSYNVYEVT